MLPWNNWLHCTGSTYGTWLRGDPRGWRVRHHREHVNGDYKNPPPEGMYEELHERSRELMTRDAVFLEPRQRTIACKVLGQTLLYHKVELIDLCVDSTHFHLLGRFLPIGTDPRNPGIRIPGLPVNRDVDDYELMKRYARHILGIAKKNSARELTDSGLVQRGVVWAVRSLIHPVTDREHQLNVVRYIRDHVHHGAAVWSAVRRAE